MWSSYCAGDSGKWSTTHSRVCQMVSATSPTASRAWPAPLSKAKPFSVNAIGPTGPRELDVVRNAADEQIGEYAAGRGTANAMPEVPVLGVRIVPPAVLIVGCDPFFERMIAGDGGRCAATVGPRQALFVQQKPPNSSPASPGRARDTSPRRGCCSPPSVVAVTFMPATRMVNSPMDQPCSAGRCSGGSGSATQRMPSSTLAGSPNRACLDIVVAPQRPANVGTVHASSNSAPRHAAFKDERIADVPRHILPRHGVPVPSAVAARNCHESNVSARGVTPPIVGKNTLRQHCMSLRLLPRMTVGLAREALWPWVSTAPR